MFGFIWHMKAVGTLQDLNNSSLIRSAHARTGKSTGFGDVDLRLGNGWTC